MAAELKPWLEPRDPSGPALLAVGAMNFGNRTAADEALRIVSFALDRGLVFFDTANAYGEGESERILGRALKGRRERAIIGTKVGVGSLRGGPREGLRAATIAAAVEQSLRRLDTDWIDLYSFHSPDHATPIEESLEATAKLVEAGKVRAIGFSNYASWQALEAIHVAKERGFPRPSVGQMLYNLLIRELEIEFLRFAERHRVHTMVFNPLAGGLLAGHHHLGPAPEGSRFAKNKMYQKRYWTVRSFEQVDKIHALAEEAGLSILQLAYGWLARRSGVDSILIGPGEVLHLEQAIDAASCTLPAEVIGALDRLHRDHLGTDAHYAR